ncbi:MAG: redoxin domain-containing protein [Bacteroidetes bacterium]|nr:MAG: redoxin domain-containing protein [Bacteroidota bacterium]
MKKKIFALITLLSITLGINAQLANGSIAPDFSVYDLNGNTHRLYDYLDQGKTVYIDFFGTHCPTCWAYHNTHALNDLHNQYGADGTNEIVVLAIDIDANNGPAEFNGISGSTQGNWISGSNYVFCNPEGSSLESIINDYNLKFIPTIYAICPNREVTLIGKQTTEVLYQHVASCGPLGIHESEARPFQVFVNASHQLEIRFSGEAMEKSSIRLIDLVGKEVFSGKFAQNKVLLPISERQMGAMLFVEVQFENGEIHTSKVLLQ